MNRTLVFATALLSSAIVTAVSGVCAQTAVKPDTVLVSNARAKVTYEDLIAELERLPEENRLEFMLSPKRVATVIENILINKVMAAEARQSGLQNNPKAAAEIRNQTEKVLAKYRREEIEATVPKIDLTPLARELYLTRLKNFERPAVYSSWHALIKTKARTHDAALELARTVKEKVDAGEPLEALARQYSDDESVTINAGFIRPTPLSYLDRGFANTLEKLKVNESAIVETDYGVHVVRLIKMVPRNRPTFEDLKPEMLAEAEKTYQQRSLETYLNKLRSDPTMKVDSEALARTRPKLPEIPPPPPDAAPARLL